MLLDSGASGYIDKDDGGSEKSNDSMAAQQHIEQRSSGQAPMLSPLNFQPLSKEHIEEKTVGMTGHKKTNVLVSEIKKHYKLNKLKSFLEQEANQTRGIPNKLASQSTYTKKNEDAGTVKTLG